LHQQGGASAPASATKTQPSVSAKTAFERAVSSVAGSDEITPTSDASGSTASPSANPNSTTVAPAKTNPNPLPPGTALSALMVHAAVLASNARQTLAAKKSVMEMPSAKPGHGSSAETASAKSLSALVPGGSDPSTPMSQVLVTANISVGPGQELPFFGLSMAGRGSAAQEKKSAAASPEGSFIQPGTSAPNLATSRPDLLLSSVGITPESSVNQQLTSVVGSINPSFNNHAASAFSLAGIANVEKGKAMNDDLNFPEAELLSVGGANIPSSQGTPDLHVQLSSNNDFSDALRQVMHVAELTQTNESRAPLRVAMEIQTPPGAIVNVYVSRQNDEWRAQLSTNDPQALSWVQDQVASLRQSNDIGVEVKWLPPQMESGPATSAGPDPNLAWDRGGQGQSTYQQPDERQPSGRQKKAEALTALAAVEPNEFMNTLTALGRAA
jgi:hypothetical protein